MIERKYQPPQYDTTDTIRVVQFNTLADSLSDAFPHTDPECLQWHNRYPRLVTEIQSHEGDIIAMEEVDHFDKFQEALPEYEGIIVLKHQDKTPRDGTCIFYRRDRFQCIEQYPGHYGHHPQAYLIVTLFDKRTQMTFCVAATHLKAKIGFEKRRLKQGKLLLEAALEKSQGKPLVVLGDFNDEPDSLVVRHFMAKLTSALDTSLWTTWKKRKTEMKRTIDYIFVSDAIEVVAYLCPPSDDQCPVLLPAAYYPSDHLAIAAVLKIKPSL